MKRLWHGFRRIYAEQFWLCILWIFCLLIFFGSFHLGEFSGRPMIFSMLMLIGIPVAAYLIGKQRSSYGPPSSTVLTEPSPVSMAVQTLERDRVTPRYEASAGGTSGAHLILQAPDPGYLDCIYVTFENKTGAPIETDTSFSLERQQGLKWYQVIQNTQDAPPWEATVLAEGTSAPICLTVLGRYPYLPHGSYRVVKHLATRQGPVTVAAVFTVDRYHNL